MEGGEPRWVRAEVEAGVAGGVRAEIEVALGVRGVIKSEAAALCPP